MKRVQALVGTAGVLAVLIFACEEGSRPSSPTTPSGGEDGRVTTAVFPSSAPVAPPGAPGPITGPPY